MVGDALDFSTLEWWLIAGGVVLTIISVAFIATVWVAALEAREYYQRENRRHRRDIEIEANSADLPTDAWR